MKQFIGFLIFVFSIGLTVLPEQVAAQLDKEFWFAAPELQVLHGDDPIYLRITATDEPVKVTISMPANTDFTPIVIEVDANSSKSVDLTPFKDIIENRLKDSITNKGLLIKGDNYFSCYYDIPDVFNGDIFALKGSNALGYQFTIPMQRLFSSYGYPNYTADFIILATQNNTTVTITPSKNLKGHAAGVPFTIVLNAGETYVGEGATNNPADKPGGSRVVADKKIVITIKDDSLYYPGFSCGDTIGDQLIPDEIAGTTFVVVKGNLYREDYYYVYAIEDSTIVSVNGVKVDTLASGEFYKGLLNENACFISTNLPVQLLHITGFGCELGGAILPGLLCTGSTSVSITRATTQGFLFNIIAPAEIINGFTINGSKSLIPASVFQAVPSTDGKWMFAKIIIPLEVIAVGGVAKVDNTLGKFHMGVIHGDGFTTCRYGYFSDFSSTKITYENYFPPFCQGAPIAKSPILVVSATDPISYQWYKNNIASNTGGTPIEGATDSALIVPLSNNTVGISYYYVKVTGNCGVVNSPVTPIEITAGTVVTTELLAPPAICIGELAPTLAVKAEGEGTLFYQWYKSATPSTATGTPIEGAILPTYTPEIQSAGTNYYFVIVTATCGVDTSAVVPVEITPCNNFCTYTQGYFGNEGGKSTYRADDGTCVTGSSTLNSIQVAIQKWISRKGEFKIGGANRYVKINNTPDDRKAVIDYLPNGGSNGPQISGQFESLRSLVVAGKDFKNTLLAQTLTLGLNLGLNWGLGYVDVSTGKLSTYKTGTCDGKKATASSAQGYNFNTTGLIDFDQNGRLTVFDVYATANQILNGTVPPGASVSTVKSVVGLLNEAFDECRSLVSNEISSAAIRTPAATIPVQNDLSVVAIPNPYRDKLLINFVAPTPGKARIELFDQFGRRLKQYDIDRVFAHQNYQVQFNDPVKVGNIIYYRVSLDKFSKSGSVLIKRE